MINRKTKGLIAFLVTILLAFSSITASLAYGASIPKATQDFYVYDDMNLLSDKTYNKIVNLNRALFEKTGGQIVFYITNDLGDYLIKDYAWDLFDNWKIGDKKENNGFLLVINEYNGDYWPVWGAGTDKVVGSSNLDRIISTFQDDYLDYELSSGVFDTEGGVDYVLDELIPYYEDYYNVSVVGSLSGNNSGGGEIIEETIVEETTTYGNYNDTSSFSSFFLILAIVIVFALISSSRRNYNSYYSNWGPTYGVMPRWSPFRRYRNHHYHSFYTPPPRYYGGGYGGGYNNHQNQRTTTTTTRYGTGNSGSGGGVFGTPAPKRTSGGGGFGAFSTGGRSSGGGRSSFGGGGRSSGGGGGGRSSGGGRSGGGRSR